MPNASRRKRIRGRLERLGVDTGAPGFYDHPAFAAEEARDPDFLETYAWFVEDLDFTPEYLARARTRIREAATFMFEELREDGRTGACIDASTVLGRMLDREGIWNYAVKGALTILPPPVAGCRPTHFGPIVLPGNPASAGHVWLVAPPYRIVDVTVSRQTYHRGELRYLPDLMLAESAQPAHAEPADLLDPDAFEHFVRAYGRAPTMADIERIAPGLAARVRAWGPVELSHGQARLRYVPCGITALDGTLDKAKNLILRGKLPSALYAEFTKRPTMT